jgi:FrmR/RcnR family transcriptional regulator, repressor of frmRAB operon
MSAGRPFSGWNCTLFSRFRSFSLVPVIWFQVRLRSIGGYPIYVIMAHTIREKKKLLARVGRIRGQIEAIERALNDEAECERIMHMIAGVRGGVAGLMAEVVEDHIRTHLVDPERNPGALNADAADQLIEVVHTYLK